MPKGRRKQNRQGGGGPAERQGAKEDTAAAGHGSDINFRHKNVSNDEELRKEIVNATMVKEFESSTYYDSFCRATLAYENAKGKKELRNAADLLWEAFEQASEQGLWSPGRVFMFLALNYALFSKKKAEANGVVKQSDFQNLFTLFHDENELAVIKLIAAWFLNDSNTTFFSPEEKMEIVREALLFEPTEEEAEHVVVVFNFSEITLYGEDTASVLDLIQFFKSELKADMEYDGYYKLESYPAELDAELHCRTTEVGGCKCDYCHTTVEELGVTKLMICGKCQNAYYCDAKCQHKAWKEGGHKKACRPKGDIYQGDIMRLVGIKKKHEMNGRLVKVMKQDLESRRWTVTLLSEGPNGAPFSVKAGSLMRIRPEA